ncbi:MAG: acyloxyacyl hydrolase [Opitutales bacterium]
MKSPILPVIFALLLPALLFGESKDFRFSELGFRAGIDAEEDVSLDAYEIYGQVATPWQWEWTEDLAASLAFEASAGIFHGSNETAGFFRAAPTLHVKHRNYPARLAVAAGVSRLTEDTFGDHDLGGTFQFSSSIGLDWEFVSDWHVGYRFRHFSNAGIHSTNPGLNLHLFALGHSF